EVSGVAASGFFRYCIEPGIVRLHTLKDEIAFDCKIVEKQHRERLLLGCHKAQDVMLIRRRCDIREIVPIWFFLAQSFPAAQTKKWPQEAFSDIFHAGFEDLFFPSFKHAKELGYSLPELFPLEFFATSYAEIRALFFQEESDKWLLLPQLLKEFHAGRLIDLQTQKRHRVAIEWSKKMIRRMTIEAACDDSIQLQLKPDVKRFRLSTKHKRLGQFLNGSRLELQSGERYLLDHFEQ
ncbi:MAG TPA: hypothetical protein VN457_01055, partial [Chlamydiales bacterium]|nr:hypothetical protein [Chlamydiales bacterium]